MVFPTPILFFNPINKFFLNCTYSSRRRHSYYLGNRSILSFFILTRMACNEDTCYIVPFKSVIIFNSRRTGPRVRNNCSLYKEFCTLTFIKSFFPYVDVNRKTDGRLLVEFNKCSAHTIDVNTRFTAIGCNIRTAYGLRIHLNRNEND